MIFDGIESSAELQQELQDLEGVKLLRRFVHGLLSNERGRLCDVLDEIGQEAGLAPSSSYMAAVVGYAHILVI